MKTFRTRQRRRRTASGQALTEYGSMIAFVAAIIVILFAMPQSSLYNSISNAFASLSSSLMNVASWTM